MLHEGDHSLSVAKHQFKRCDIRAYSLSLFLASLLLHSRLYQAYFAAPFSISTSCDVCRILSNLVYHMTTAIPTQAVPKSTQSHLYLCLLCRPFLHLDLFPLATLRILSRLAFNMTTPIPTQAVQKSAQSHRMFCLLAHPHLHIDLLVLANGRILSRSGI